MPFYGRSSSASGLALRVCVRRRLSHRIRQSLSTKSVFDIDLLSHDGAWDWASFTAQCASLSRHNAFVALGGVNRIICYNWLALICRYDWLRLPVAMSTEYRIHISPFIVSGHNAIFNWAMRTAEGAVHMAVQKAAPIVSRLDGPIQYVDQTLCSGIDKLEAKAPIIKEQPQEIYLQAKTKVVDVVQPTLSRVCSMRQAGQQKAASLKELSWQKANEVLATQYGCMAVTGVDNTSALANRLLDYYFPCNENEFEDDNGKHRIAAWIERCLLFYCELNCECFRLVTMNVNFSSIFGILFTRFVCEDVYLRRIGVELRRTRCAHLSIRSSRKGNWFSIKLRGVSLHNETYTYAQFGDNSLRERSHDSFLFRFS